MENPHIGGGHREELVDHYWGSINYVSSLIRASEIKAGLILSFYGILFNIIYQNLELVMEQATDYPILYVLLILWFIFTAASIYFSIRCFMPHIEAKFNKNIFFFRDVITKYGSIKEFSKTFYHISLNEVELFDQLGQQIYINSKIASIKFKNVNRSIRLLAVELAILFIISIYYMIITK
ncbi:MAG: ABC transporter ATP-binding protein [Maribacter sp.]|nr:ABC transporter ATP-binding protein [Maribacter sp.]